MACRTELNNVIDMYNIRNKYQIFYDIHDISKLIYQQVSMLIAVEYNNFSVHFSFQVDNEGL